MRTALLATLFLVSACDGAQFNADTARLDWLEAHMPYSFTADPARHNGWVVTLGDSDDQRTFRQMTDDAMRVTP